MEEKREPWKVVGYGGREREPEKQSISVARERTGVGKGVYKIGHKACVCSGASGGRVGPDPPPTPPTPVLGSGRILADPLTLQRAETEAAEGKQCA